MQQIADWLEQLGLGQYAQRFAENDITVAILPDLTDQDLKELGVASLGHRRQLLRAIGERNRLEQRAPRPPISSASPVAPYDTAEPPATIVVVVPVHRTDAVRPVSLWRLSNNFELGL